MKLFTTSGLASGSPPAGVVVVALVPGTGLISVTLSIKMTSLKFSVLAPSALGLALFLTELS